MIASVSICILALATFIVSLRFLLDARALHVDAARTLRAAKMAFALLELERAFFCSDASIPRREIVTATSTSVTGSN